MSKNPRKKETEKENFSEINPINKLEITLLEQSIVSKTPVNSPSFLIPISVIPHEENIKEILRSVSLPIFYAVAKA